MRLEGWQQLRTRGHPSRRRFAPPQDEVFETPRKRGPQVRCVIRHMVSQVSAAPSGEGEWRRWCGWSAAATFEGAFFGVTKPYAGKGVVRYQW
jgi:hypothetical protein